MPIVGMPTRKKSFIPKIWGMITSEITPMQVAMLVPRKRNNNCFLAIASLVILIFLEVRKREYPIGINMVRMKIGTNKSPLFKLIPQLYFTYPSTYRFVDIFIVLNRNNEIRKE